VTWIEHATRTLRRNLSEKVFSARDAAVLLSRSSDYSHGTTYRILHDLVKAGILLKVGRGLFRFPTNVTIGLSDRIAVSDELSATSVPEIDLKARSAVVELGIPFRISGLSLLSPYLHLFPRKMVHIVYVTKGGGESAKGTLARAGIKSLINPSPRETSLALRELPDLDLFIIRERSDIEREKSELADPEGAWVDTYFESTRGRIPFPREEVGRSLATALASGEVSISHLLMHAGRRGVRDEVRPLLESTISGLRIPGSHSFNEHVEEVLKGVSSMTR